MVKALVPKYIRRLFSETTVKVKFDTCHNTTRRKETLYVKQND